MIEFLEDVIEERPYEEFPSDVQTSGMIVHRTGDKVFDEWQVKAAKEEDIDFMEAFDAKSKKAFQAVLDDSRAIFKSRNPVAPTLPADVVLPEDVHDDYSGK